MPNNEDATILFAVVSSSLPVVREKRGPRSHYHGPRRRSRSRRWRCYVDRDEAVNHVVMVRRTAAHTADSIAPRCTRRRRAPAAAQERCPMEGRGPVAAAAVGVAFVVRRRDEAGSTSCPPSCSRRRTASACPCCAARWSGGFGNYGSLKEGKGDKKFDGVTKNSMVEMRRVKKELCKEKSGRSPWCSLMTLILTTKFWV